MRVSATAKYLRRSTRKTRLVTQAIIGKPVEEAAALLRFMPQGAARDVAKVLKSAAANAENNHDLSVDDLVVADGDGDVGHALVDRERPTLGARAEALDRGAFVGPRVEDAELIRGQVEVVLSVRGRALQHAGHVLCGVLGHEPEQGGRLIHGAAPDRLDD